MFSHMFSCVFIYYTFHIPFSFIYFMYFTCSYPFRVLYFVLSIYYIHVLFMCYFHIPIFMYCSFHILFSCYTFHMIVIYCAFHLILSYTILSYDIHILCFSYAFHILYLSYTFRVIATLFLVLVYLSYTFLFHILYCSYTFHVLYFSYTVILYITSCSCNCLYFHRIGLLCFSFHVIYSIHVISF